MLRTTAAAVATLLLSTAAAAQMQASPTQTGDAPQQSAVRANDQAAAADAARGSADADAQAQYAADIAAYQRALAQHDNQADRNQAHYEHQQRAYADAMAAWRAQDYACHHGHTRACNAPTPDPAAFW